jgi:hypothetical protein
MAEIPKPFSHSQIEVGWPRTFLGTGVIFLLLSLAAYLVLAGYEGVANRRVQDLDKEIQDIASSLPESEIDQLLTLDRQIKSLKRLLPTHSYLSRILEFMEVNAHPQVRITSLGANYSTRRILLQAFAPNIDVASIQAAAFERAQATEEIALKNVNALPGGTSFTVEMLFMPELVLPR